jgi:hypothetical protein
VLCVCCDVCRCAISLPSSLPQHCLPDDHKPPVDEESEEEGHGQGQGEQEWACPRHFCRVCRKGEQELELEVARTTPSSQSGGREVVDLVSSDTEEQEKDDDDSTAAIVPRVKTLVMSVQKGVDGKLGVKFEAAAGGELGAVVLIRGCAPGSHAAGLLLPNDQVVAVNKLRVSAVSFKALLEEVQTSSSRVMLTVRRKQQQQSGMGSNVVTNKVVPSSSSSTSSSTSSSSSSSSSTSSSSNGGGGGDNAHAFAFISCTECSNSFCHQHAPAPIGGQDSSTSTSSTWERVRVLCNFIAPRHVGFRPCSAKCLGRFQVADRAAANASANTSASASAISMSSGATSATAAFRPPQTAAMVVTQRPPRQAAAVDTITQHNAPFRCWAMLHDEKLFIHEKTFAMRGTYLNLWKVLKPDDLKMLNEGQIKTLAGLMMPVPSQWLKDVCKLLMLK